MNPYGARGLKITSLSKLIPIGYSTGAGECLVKSLKKIRESSCVKFTVSNKEKKGEFVVCNGKLYSAKWDGKEGEEAWNAMLEYVNKSKDLLNLLFFPPPEEISLLEEMSADALVAADVSSGYIASYGVVSLGKAVLGFLHKLEALGAEIRDVKIEVTDGIARIKLELLGDVPWDVVSRIALEYFKDFEVEKVVPW